MRVEEEHAILVSLTLIFNLKIKKIIKETPRLLLRQLLRKRIMIISYKKLLIIVVIIKKLLKVPSVN